MQELLGWTTGDEDVRSDEQLNRVRLAKHVLRVDVAVMQVLTTPSGSAVLLACRPRRSCLLPAGHSIPSLSSPVNKGMPAAGARVIGTGGARFHRHLSVTAVTAQQGQWPTS